ncbi:hypothetical protein NAT51_01895 [Flavobacterium amniphilum]|uniref:hypothetical protein n=1 Tax=Flavobacterium amniphilum TaxID=1834035 RepID=UPI00202A0DD1|nr:hypothetical protein [Flavobacterium amniphilum]MCL9804259.1 hypothetical protein [Flavobacterium amniphilum]
MKFKYIVTVIIVVIGILSVILYSSIKDADIEYRYGDFAKMYHQFDDSKSYFVIIDKNKTGFLLKYGDVLLVEDQKCLTHLTDYSPSQTEVYQFVPEETFDKFTLKEAEELTKKKTTQLVFEPIKLSK